MRAELNRLRAQAGLLKAAAKRPIDAVIASYEHIARQYGVPAVGKNGGQS